MATTTLIDSRGRSRGLCVQLSQILFKEDDVGSDPPSGGILQPQALHGSAARRALAGERVSSFPAYPANLPGPRDSPRDGAQDGEGGGGVWSGAHTVPPLAHHTEAWRGGGGRGLSDVSV